MREGTASFLLFYFSIRKGSMSDYLVHLNGRLIPESSSPIIGVAWLWLWLWAVSVDRLMSFPLLR